MNRIRYVLLILIFFKINLLFSFENIKTLVGRSIADPSYVEEVKIQESIESLDSFQKEVIEKDIIKVSKRKNTKKRRKNRANFNKYFKKTYEKYECACGCIFNKAKLSQHLKIHKKKEDSIICTMCKIPSYFTKEVSFRNHLVCHKRTLKLKRVNDL